MSTPWNFDFAQKQGDPIAQREQQVLWSPGGEMSLQLDPTFARQNGFQSPMAFTPANNDGTWTASTERVELQFTEASSSSNGSLQGTLTFLGNEQTFTANS